MGLEISITVNGAPDEELGAASQVEIHESAGASTSFTLRFDLEISEGNIPLLADSRLDPGSEIAVLVPVEGETYCLVKGPIHGQNIHLNHGGAESYVEVKGSDTTVTMDRITQSTVWADMKDSDVVQSILGAYGYAADVQDTNAMHEESKHTLIQRESDLGFIRRLARRNGFNFWLTCDAAGTETAHFKRPPLEGATAELVINFEDPHLSSLDISWDVEHPTSITGKQLDLNTKTEIDVAVAQTPQAILGDQGLIDITGDTRSVHLSAPADDAGDLQARGEGALIEADWFVTANCQTTLENLGKLVRPNTVIDIRGAGSRHSGSYFVKAVRHLIDAVEHQMEIDLIRNGWN